VAPLSDEGDWTHHGKVRAREAEGVLEVVIDGLTTQAKYYKPLIYEFFRKAWRGSRPALVSPATRESLHSQSPPWGGDGGEFSVEIRMEYVGDPPWLDLDNLAKAILDAIKGYAFHDDAQVARLLVERVAGERERITVRVRKVSEAALTRPGEVLR
jgi:crossover junction endodeoxyribonuclease RusA